MKVIENDITFDGLTETIRAKLVLEQATILIDLEFTVSFVLDYDKIRFLNTAPYLSDVEKRVTMSPVNWEYKFSEPIDNQLNEIYTKIECVGVSCSLFDVDESELSLSLANGVVPSDLPENGVKQTLTVTD